MKPFVYITIPDGAAFLNGLCSIMGNANFAPLSVSDFVFELKINDSISQAKISKFMSTRIYPNDNEYRMINNDEFLALTIMAKKANILNLL